MNFDPVPKRTSIYRHRVRYFEADQQGVVFNMWYLGYFDEAMALFLEEGGLPYRRMLEAGFDVQLVRTEIDWRSSLRWPDDATVEVGVEGAGRTSFTLGFTVRRAGEGDVVADGRTVYVVVGTDGSGKRPIPAELAGALGVAA
ncbi:MAG TPA: thioesterase family protein [Acidimicrobiales bacterium]|nr:thioesterase family protein [Acidimicrobiales bacterium]